MSRAVRQKVIAAAAVAVLATGGAIAAVSATGQGNHRTRHAATGRARSRDLATAASYLGVSTSRLSQQLLTGRSLAQIAEASGQGHTAAGLIAALEATKKAKLAQTERTLPTRVATEVRRPGGPIGGARLSRAARLHALFTARLPLGDAAAAYLSTTPAALERELAAGKTLAQLAAATPAKSEAGLLAALVAAERRLPAAASNGAKSAQRQSRREKHLLRRAKRLAERRFAGAPQAG